MSTLSEMHVIDFPGFPTVVVHSPGQAMGTLPQFMDTAFRALGAAVQRGAFAPAGPAFSKYRGLTGGSGEAPESVDLEVGYPVDVPLAVLTGDVGPSILPLVCGREGRVRWCRIPSSWHAD